MQDKNSNSLASHGAGGSMQMQAAKQGNKVSRCNRCTYTCAQGAGSWSRLPSTLPSSPSRLPPHLPKAFWLPGGDTEVPLSPSLGHCPGPHISHSHLCGKGGGGVGRPRPRTTHSKVAADGRASGRRVKGIGQVAVVSGRGQVSTTAPTAMHSRHSNRPAAALPPCPACSWPTQQHTHSTREKGRSKGACAAPLPGVNQPPAASVARLAKRAVTWPSMYTAAVEVAVGGGGKAGFAGAGQQAHHARHAALPACPATSPASEGQGSLVTLPGVQSAANVWKPPE